MNARSVRTDLAETLYLDLVGPWSGHQFEAELLPESPTGWYLTGFLVPVNADDDLRTDDTADEEVDSGPEKKGLDDDAPVDRSIAGKQFLPSSMGLTCLVGDAVKSVEVEVSWGDYTHERYMQGEGEEAKESTGWRRQQRREIISLDLTKLPEGEQVPFEVPNSRVQAEDPEGLVVACAAPNAGRGGRRTGTDGVPGE